MRLSPGTPAPDVTPDAAHAARSRARRRGPRAAAYAAGGVVAVAAAVALVVNLVSGGGTPGGSTEAAGAASAWESAVPSPTGEHRTGSGRTTPSSAPSAPSPPPDRTGTGSPSASGTAGERGPAAPSGGAPSSSATAARGPLLAVSTTPFAWDSPCDQSFLVDRSPRNVPPPPAQQDAVGWAAALGAVAADSQMVVLTVQGTGADTVVLGGLHARVVSSGPLLDWRQYAMGSGCGGGVGTTSFDVSLDLGNPPVKPIGGQRDFPYKVSESDPEVFRVTAHTSGHDVRWYLELDWSSGNRRGTLRVDDHGRPFRTSASRTPAYYGYPLGADSSWEWFSGT
ncbi:hypothetical protein [Streptomyces sp. SHP 1-2]|uniref:hypothetical protein n=1 Tax=Streptomyces sp. SHP 1-2 TaxID=2769489 RepID=UPI002238818F|nr:hypothetical protein [Streptomyces sp. SHP 1-2]MCW5253039.1 hypothetical protein [Streptomyces sp. SHP 1-2]